MTKSSAQVSRDYRRRQQIREEETKQKEKDEELKHQSLKEKIEKLENIKLVLNQYIEKNSVVNEPKGSNNEIRLNDEQYFEQLSDVRQEQTLALQIDSIEHLNVPDVFEDDFSFKTADDQTEPDNQKYLDHMIQNSDYYINHLRIEDLLNYN